MVSCGGPGCTNRADKTTSNIITLVTIIIMLLQCYNLFRAQAYLMSEAYSKPRQISKMM